jgi:hypothetical protein
MRGPSAIRKLAIGAAIAATVVSLVAAAPAAADTDRYGNRLEFETPCNPATAGVVGLFGAQGGGGTLVPLFKNGLAWVDYFGIPVALSPFTAQLQTDRGGSRSFYSWPVPSASQVPRGEYTLHVLWQLNGDAFNPLYAPFANFVFTTLSETTTIDPALNQDCTPIAAATSASASRAATRKPSRRVLARRVKALRRDSDIWLEGSLGATANYPKARFCGKTICVKRRADAAWEPVARR